MKYGDLISFDPIVSVIQLLDAKQADNARRMVESYAISDGMADKIVDVLVPQLGFDDAVDHRGILVVGHYGTGKSHLLSVLSSIAEDAGNVSLIRNDKVRAAVAAIAGKFKVHRIEISSQMSLRAIITTELEGFLAGLDIDFKFPPADAVVNNKAALSEMMAAFDAKFPGQGLVVLVDEMLDYLRSRKDTDLVNDLSILREIGEFASHTRFRFVGGVQEAVFDGGRFAHVASSLIRVKDRFQQVLIDRQDITFVVAERLLRKSAAQRQEIRDHLEPFAAYYGSMGERMDQFVRLFPVHPDYLRIFENIGFTEKRSALTTLSGAIGKLLAEEVPEGLPGLITYDSFWEEIRTNPVLRADPNVRDVMRVSAILDEKVRAAFPKAKATYAPMALRLINGLSVHRLTTGDIHTAVGPSCEQLRDELMLFHPMIAQLASGEPASDLLALIQTTLRDVLKTVNGQFITLVPDSDQAYLDVAKDVDFDTLIDKRAESLDDAELDGAYFKVIAALMERVDDPSYVTGHQIWQHELEWFERKVHRNGYLFFGGPRDRPTAQPDRDFYLYFLQPFDRPSFKDGEHADEVFLSLAKPDDTLVGDLRRYAASIALAQGSSGNAKTIYTAKAEDAQKEVRKWIRDNRTTAIEITHQGKTKTLEAWSKGVLVRDRTNAKTSETVNFRDHVNVIAGHLLAPHFKDTYPEYPTFTAIVTEQSRRVLCAAAVRWIAGGTRTKDAVVVMDALKLLDGDAIAPATSPYATALLGLLSVKGSGQVLNRQEVFSGGAGNETFLPGRFGIEPELVAVVLAALVHSGDVILAIVGKKLDSTSIAALGQQTIEELASFKHVEAPKEVNVQLLRDLFALLGLAPAVAQAAAGGDEEAVRGLQAEVQKLILLSLTLTAGLDGKLVFWGHPILGENQLAKARLQAEAVRTFVEALSPYDTPGKLKNLRITSAEVVARQDDFAGFRQLAKLTERIAHLSGEAAYLGQAEMVLREDDPWIASAEKLRTMIAGQLGTDLTQADLGAARGRLATLKRDYIAQYLSLHVKARLGMEEDKSKKNLISDKRFGVLDKLKAVPILPTNELVDLRARIGDLKTCAGLVESELAGRSRCPHCDFTPRNEQISLIPPSSVLSDLDDRLDSMLSNWVARLRDEFKEPAARKNNLELVSESERDRVRIFADGGPLPEPLDQPFILALQEALSGLSKVEIGIGAVHKALTAGGSPFTVEDLRARFERFVSARLKGGDGSKVRFVVVEGAN